jgi:hypothetical protein
MKPRFRPGEIVRVVGTPDGAGLPAGEGLVEEIAGPTEGGDGWNVTIRLGESPGPDSLALFSESQLEPTGMGENDLGERIILEELPVRDDPRTCLELRLFTEIADGIEAARVAETIESELAELLGRATVEIEAERHWSEPYNYELAVTVHPHGDPVEALRLLAAAGAGGFIACRDDGWRCELWWSATADPDAVLIVPEVHGADISFLPWSSPARRPESERPLVEVDLPEAVEEPDYDDPEEDQLGDAQAGDEEA